MKATDRTLARSACTCGLLFAFMSVGAFASEPTIIDSEVARIRVERVVEERKVVHEERLLEQQAWRVSFVEQVPDGFIYIGTDERKILRLVPVAETR